MDYALIKSGKVENIIVADAAFIEAISGEWDHVEHLTEGIPVGIGWGWDGGVFSAPAAAPPAPEDLRRWWIDVGPFKDRLGMDAPAIYASTHDACKGVVGMVEGRKYINLKDPRIAGMMGVLIATAQPVANPVWPGSGPMTAAKRDAVLNTPTTEDERHIKGLA